MYAEVEAGVEIAATTVRSQTNEKEMIAITVVSTA